MAETMSLQSLTTIHTATRYSLTETKDAAGFTRQTLGSAQAALKCRFVPLNRQDRLMYEEGGLVEMYQVLFSSNPGLSLLHVLVWGDKVWRVVEYVNSSELSRLWVAVVKHIPQTELAAS